MTHKLNIAKTISITAFILISVGFVITSVAQAAEVTGTLDGNANIGNTITGSVGGSTVSGSVGGGTSGGSTVTGTVSSGGGGGGGGNILGGGIINNDPQGIVLGASTNVSNVPGGGAVLGVSTGVPNTGAGGNAMVTLLFILALSLVAGTSTYVVSRRVIR